VSQPNTTGREFFSRLTDLVAQMDDDWRIYNELFGRGEKRIDTLDRRTGRVFECFQDALSDAVVLEIAKLLDPPKMGGKETLSLARAIEELPLDPRDSRKTNLEKQLSGIRRQCMAIVMQRHNRIAHNNRAVALEVVGLPNVTRKMLGDAILAIEEFVNRLSLVRNNSEVRFGVFFNRLGEVDELFRVLEKGNDQLTAEQRARRTKFIELYGNPDLPDEFDPGPDC
jgi:hypothetical protein